MPNNLCPQCGAPLDPQRTKCEYCGFERTVQPVQKPQVQPQQQQVNPVYTAPLNQTTNVAISPAWPIKSKVAAGILAIFLGGLGIHKFYLGKIGMGVLYLLFCWTYIPSLIGFIEGIIYLCSNDENFQLKHHVRLK